jgi:hypothetical protein
MNARGKYRRISLRSPKEDGYSPEFLAYVAKRFPYYSALPPWQQWWYCRASYEQYGKDKK